SAPLSRSRLDRDVAEVLVHQEEPAVPEAHVLGLLRAPRVAGPLHVLAPRVLAQRLAADLRRARAGARAGAERQREQRRDQGGSRQLTPAHHRISSLARSRASAGSPPLARTGVGSRDSRANFPGTPVLHRATGDGVW